MAPISMFYLAIYEFSSEQRIMQLATTHTKLVVVFHAKTKDIHTQGKQNENPAPASNRVNFTT